MFLIGTYERTLDEKNRLVFPKRIREQLKDPERLYVTPAPGPEQCLWLFTQGGLEQMAEKLDRAPATDSEAQVFKRLYFAQTEALDMDRTGRVLIPERLTQFAGLKHEVVLIGAGDHLELWDAPRWNEYLAQHGSKLQK